MEYHVQFGTLSSKRAAAAASRGQAFRIGLLGDFSGKGNVGRVDAGDSLASRKPLRVTHENLDAILERLDVNLNLPAGASGAMISVPIKCLDDFHPDQLFSNVPLFEKLVSLRQKLQDPSTFPKAAAAVRSLAVESGMPPPLSSRSSSSVVPRRRIDSFSDLMNQEARTYEAPELKTLLRDAVGGHVMAEMQDQAALIAAVDLSLSDLMRRLLHHPDFQALESLWRSLDFILHRLELDKQLEIVLYDINAAEMAADLASSESLDQTVLYRWLVENPSLDANQGPLSLLICNFVFEKVPPHAELLARAAKIAAAAGAPLVAAIDCAVLKKVASEEVHPLVAQAWQMLRDLPESAYLGLTTPRFMLRWPYGKKTEPIESFAFEEFTAKSGLSGMLWGNSAFLAGLSIAQTYVNEGLKSMKLGSVLTVDDIPFYYYNDAYGDQTALPCTERLINVATAGYVASQGFIPALSIQGRPEVRLGGLHSITGALLAGPWAPANLAASPTQPDTPALSVAAADTPVEAMESGAPPESAGVDDDLAALLDSLGDDAPNEPEPSVPEPSASTLAAEVASVDDDLDNLLASLDSSDAEKSAEQSESDVDADLAAMLADL